MLLIVSGNCSTTVDAEHKRDIGFGWSHILKLSKVAAQFLSLPNVVPKNNDLKVLCELG